MTEMYGISDLQVLKFVQAFYIVEVCQMVEDSHPLRILFMRLLELSFEDYKDELLAQPREFDLLRASLVMPFLY
jgi:hypothetical protein